MTEQLTVRATATWLWYLERDAGGGVALDASSTTGQLAADLSLHFSEVHVLRRTTSALDEIRAYGEHVGSRPYAPTVGTILSAPWGDHAFDCIAVHDTFAKCDPKAVETIERLDRIRLLLKAGGWFVGATPNTSYVRHRRTGAVGISPRVFSRMLVEAQFREIRRIFVVPSLDDPVTLIPDAPRAVNAYEAFDSIRGTTKWTRRVLARLGLRKMLYPAFLILARA